ncbi:MAG: CDP-glycerol glycerophosphotransferase family protein, partial [Rhodospirillales bacterium]
MNDRPDTDDQDRLLRRISRRKRKSPLVLFFGRREAFSDNSKYLYLDACRQDYGFAPLWMTTSAEIATALSAQDLPVLNAAADRTETLRHLLKAAAAVYCTNPNEAVPETDYRAALDGAWKLQLWHGVFAGRQDLQVTDVAPALSPPLLRQLEGASSVDATLSPAASYDDRFMEAFGAALLIRDGYPRNEALDRPSSPHDLIAAFPPPARPAGEAGPAILYCPSHTRLGQPLWRDPALVGEFSNLSKRLGARIYIKPHPFEAAIALKIGLLAPGVTLIPALADIYPALP